MLKPPAVKGKLISINYITQVNAGPAVLACYCNYPKLIPMNYKRYLENKLREKFDLEGVPVKLSFRKK